MTFDIVLLAIVAAFLGLRLYSVLGKRTGHEQEPMLRSQEEMRNDKIHNDNGNDPTVVDINVAQQPATIVQNAVIIPEMIDASSEQGIRDIMSADRGFNLPQFGLGAKSAYEMTLEAFWSGDRDALKTLCDADVYADFEAVIAAREEAGQIVENRLVRIDQARIVDAEFDKPMARITVRFDADIAALTKDKEGKVIAGSLSDAIEAHDIWTFERDVKNSDRNWTLIATDAAE